MLMLNAQQVKSLAPIASVIDCLDEAFRRPYIAPARQVVPVPGGDGRLLLCMPAFAASGSGAVKLATVFPDNPARARPTIQGLIVVFSETGEPCAVLDGASVTRLRTAAASALASRYLSREDSAQLVLIGTGALAPFMALAHCAVRSIRHVSVVGRRPDRAAATVASILEVVAPGVDVAVADDVERAVSTADIISCCTSSATPVFSGTWLRPGVFVDLVGSFSPTRREADDAAIVRSRIFVDTFEGALAEAGDLLDPIRRGVISREQIAGELADLASGRMRGRRSEDEIILFKSVGTALEDLAAARMIVASVAS